MRTTEVCPVVNIANMCIDSIAADKSISHRSVIFSFLSNQKSRVKNYLFGEDTLNTLKVAIHLGLEVLDSNGNLNDVDSIKHSSEIYLYPRNGINEPSDILYCGNAGTAIRLYMGLLAPNKGQFILSGDKYLNSRPMARIIKPLNSIGANISARCDHTLAPICINGATLKPFDYFSDISSAQVKSAMILSALQIDGVSKFSEISKSRDHSERMLIGMGANLEINSNEITIFSNKNPLNPLDITIPADPSSAFYFAILAAISKDTKVVLKNILLNPTRIEAFYVLQKMGVDIDIEITSSQYENVGNITIKNNNLNAITIDSNISWLIDEIPALAIAFACANGVSKVVNAKELRFKESDRIKATLEGIRAFGVKCEELDDGFIIEGGINKIHQHTIIDSYGDHRIAMSFAILGIVYGVIIKDSACIDVSFPNFLDILKTITEIKNY